MNWFKLLKKFDACQEGLEFAKQYLMTQAENYIEGRRAQIRLEEVLKEADEVLATKDPSIFDNVKESA